MKRLEKLIGWPRKAQDREPRSDAGARSFHILDPALIDQSGHHLTYNQVLGNAARRLGYRTVHHTHAGADPALPGLQSARGHFSDRGYESLWKMMNRGRRFDSQAEISAFLGELDKAETGIADRGSVLAFPTIFHFQQRAVADWLLTQDLSNRPVVLLWHIFDDTFMTTADAQARWAREELSAGFQALNEASRRGAGISVFCETERMRDHLREIGARNATTLRPMSSYRCRRQPAPHVPDRPIGKAHIVFSGHTNEAKGFRLLPEIVRRTWETHPDIHYSIQSHPGFDQASFAAVTKELRSLGPRIRIAYGPLFPDAFEGFLSRADIVLLPYDPEVYSLRGSSILSEAMAIGRPSVAPLNASFASEAIEYGICHGFDRYEPDSIADAVVRAVDDLPHLQARAREFLDERPTSESDLDAVLRANLGMDMP